MAKKEDLENIENQLSTEDKYQLAKECIEKEDYENAILYLEQLAKVDYALAEFTLANLYLAGLGVAKDEKKAPHSCWHGSSRPSASWPGPDGLYHTCRTARPPSSGLP